MRRLGRSRSRRVGVLGAVALAVVLAGASGALAAALAGAPGAAVDLSGAIRVLVTDDFGGRGEEAAWLETGTDRVRLALPAGTTTPPDGTPVRVTGTRRPDGSIAVATIRADATAHVAAQVRAATTAPNRRILVIIADFAGVNGYAATTVQANATYAGAGQTVQGFFAAASRGAVSTTATVVGPWQLGIAPTCDAWTTWSAGDSLARARGYDPAAYDHVVIWTQDVGARCGGWAGIGTIGGGHVWVAWSWPSWAGSGAAGLEAALVSHELGHNLGLQHASTLPCWDDGGNQVSLAETCATPVEYGDQFSVMGDTYTFAPLFDSDELNDLGWLAGGEAQEVTSVGTYALVPTYAATAGVRLLRIPRSPGLAGDGPGFWRLETRTALGPSFDRFDQSPGPVPLGVLIRFSTPGGAMPGSNHSYLIDGTPTATGAAGADFTDAPFETGSTFTDTAGGLTIHVDAASALGATVTIGDTEAPTGPATLTPTIGPTSVGLAWPAGSDNLGLAGYVVRRDGVTLATVTATARSWTDTTAAPITTYTYSVAAKDTAGLEGAGASIQVTTPGPPGPPSGVSTTPGDASAHATWSAPASTGGRPVTGYTATATPGGATCATTGALSCTITGLANGTPYDVTVTATNAIGMGPASSPASSVTPRTVPDRPAGVTATAGTRRATVAWTAPAWDGGSAVTGYTATATPGGTTCSTTGATSCTITGLADGTPYTVTVRAANAAGTGPSSDASTPVTPAATVVTCSRGVAGATVTVLAGSTVSCAVVPGSGAAFSGWASSGFGPSTSSAAAADFAAGAAGPASVTAAWTDDLGDERAVFGYTIADTPTAPGAPTDVSVMPGGSAAAVTWAGPVDDGASPVTGYTATASPGGRACTTAGAGCSIPGLADGVYAVTVTAANGVGRGPASAASASFRIDTVRPVVSAPVASVAGGGTLGTSSVPVRLTWSGSDAASGIGRYVLLQSTGGGPYVAVASPAASGVTRGLATSSTVTYRFRVRAFDRAGNWTDSAPGRAFRVALTQQSSTSVAWRGTWATSSNASASGRSYRTATRAGSSATYAFSGRSVGFAAYLGSSLGRVSVYVDGRLATTVDLRASTTTWRRVAFARTWTTAGAHTVRIVCQGTAGRPRVDVDAFAVLR